MLLIRMMLRSGKKLTFDCCLCNQTFTGMLGNNPFPLDGLPNQACYGCNLSLVIPARIRRLQVNSL